MSLTKVNQERLSASHAWFSGDSPGALLGTDNKLRSRSREHWEILDSPLISWPHGIPMRLSSEAGGAVERGVVGPGHT